jgi:serine/threonine-protein kinase
MGIDAVESKEHVFLQVSDKKGSILYRGSEANQVVSQGIVYREIFLEKDKGDDSCSPPPEPQPETVLAPNVVGQSEDKAVEMLKAAGLRVGKRKTASDPKRVGLVVKQNPQAGTEVTPGSAVDLLIGVAEKVSVPKLVGHPEDKAVEMLKAAQLRVGERKTTSDPKRVGLVVKQKPQFRTEVSPGTAVDLLIGVAEKVSVPELVGHPEDKAVEMLKAARLRVGERKTISDPQRVGLVVKQKPQFRTEVTPGTAVDLYIGA